MKSVKIAFFDTKPYDKESFEEVNKNFNFEIKYFKSHLSQDNAKLAAEYDVVCIFVNDSADEKVIEILKQGNVKLIALRCAGYNNIDLKAVFGNIHVVRVPAYSPYAVAEHATALILGLNRKTHRAYNRVRDGNFSLNGLLGFDLHGKTAGVVSVGRIGRCLIAILNGFGMKVLAYDVHKNEDLAKELNFTYVELDELYAKSDVISLHCPLTPETHHMINDQSIAKMKDNVMIINTGRGGLIDTQALIKGLKTKKIGAAGLDVYEEEGDYFFEDLSMEGIADDTLARLMTFPNVLITSHQAFFTQEALSAIANTTLNNIKQFAENVEILDNEICYRCGDPCKKKENKPCF